MTKLPTRNITEEDKINLSEKEFRVMIVKMTQNLGNKMEAQISKLEALTKKMQELFNKDLEELKN